MHNCKKIIKKYLQEKMVAYKKGKYNVCNLRVVKIQCLQFESGEKIEIERNSRLGEPISSNSLVIHDLTYIITPPPCLFWSILYMYPSIEISESEISSDNQDSTMQIIIG